MMKNVYKIAAISFGFLFTYIDKGYNQEKEIPFLSLTSPQENPSDNLPNVHECLIFPSEKESTVEDSFLNLDIDSNRSEKREPWESPIPLSEQDLQKNALKSAKRCIAKSINPLLDSTQRDYFTYFLEIMSCKSLFQKRCLPISKILPPKGAEVLLLDLTKVAKELRDIAEESTNKSSLKKETILEIKDTAIYSFIKEYQLYFQNLKKEAQRLKPILETFYFIEVIDRLVKKVESYPPYLEYIEQLQKSIVSNKIIPLLLESKTPKAEENAKTFTFFWDFLSNNHEIQKKNTQLKVGLPKHSWFKIIVGWQCLFERLSLKDMDDEDKERAMYETIILHKHLMEKFYKKAIFLENSSLDVQNLKSFMTEKEVISTTIWIKDKMKNELPSKFQNFTLPDWFRSIEKCFEGKLPNIENINIDSDKELYADTIINLHRSKIENSLRNLAPLEGFFYTDSLKPFIKGIESIFTTMYIKGYYACSKCLDHAKESGFKKP